jgi:hypothetical protein
MIVHKILLWQRMGEICWKWNAEYLIYLWWNLQMIAINSAIFSWHFCATLARRRYLQAVIIVRVLLFQSGLHRLKYARLKQYKGYLKTISRDGYCQIFPLNFQQMFKFVSLMWWFTRQQLKTALVIFILCWHYSLLVQGMCCHRFHTGIGG